MNAYIKKYGRTLDYYAHLLDLHQDIDLIDALRKFQNIDGGFGHGLELDIQAPISNIPSTNLAISYLDSMKDSKEREEMIKAMVAYYQTMYYENDHRWHMVEKETDAYPHAIWWNYESRDAFTSLNPTPEILGFLYKNQSYLSSFDLEQDIELMVKRIKEQLPFSKSFHEVLSILRFYRDIPYIQEDIDEVLRLKITEFILEKEGYRLRPHQVFLLNEQMIDQAVLREDIQALKKEIDEKGYIECTWQWFQHEETFEKIKPMWNAFLTRQAIQAKIKYEEEN